MVGNALNWFEIPVEDMDRALRFYNSILGVELTKMEMENSIMAMFPYDPSNGGVGGAITKTADFHPSDKGTVVYLNGGDDLSVILDRVEGAAGTVIQPKTSIGENGWVGIFKDTEGNIVGLHSNA